MIKIIAHNMIIAAGKGDMMSINYATYKQINFIKELLEELGKDPDNYNLIGLTRQEASEMINELVSEKEA